MNAYPYPIHSQEPTRKQLWMGAYLDALHHLSPEEALASADRALELANERWREPQWIRTWQYRDDYPVGLELSIRPSTPDEPRQG